MVVYHRDAGIDAIDQYTRHLVAALNARGLDARYVADGLAPALAVPATPPWVLLQYNPFRYGRAGVAPGLLADIHRLRRRFSAPLAVMVHEAWIDMTSPKSTAIGAWQRAQLRLLLRSADAIMASTEPLAAELGCGALHVPVGSNIPPAAVSGTAARAELDLDERLVIALFGRDHPSRALNYAEEAIAAIWRRHDCRPLTVLNIGSDAPPVRVPAGVELRTTGQLEPLAISCHLSASDLALLPFRDGVSTKRSTLMAALAHGVGVLGLRGHNTDPMLAQAQDAITLTDVGDVAAYARAAARLAGDRDRLARLGLSGRTLYESQFDWPVVASRVQVVLERVRAQRSRGVMFVAHHVGGSGGMERHSEELIGRILDTGRPVTVVARRCQIEPRAGLRVKRVPVPGRPFTVLYPAFFALGSVLATRRREALLHTTGALIANRSDLSTVHYCHRAAGRRVDGSRASGSGLLHKLNQLAGGPISMLGERWCYRPDAVRMLSAVSSGVLREITVEFPEISDRVRMIPNGVDPTVFHPDAATRAATRSDLGLTGEDKLALFVGGDWDRKGLPLAIAALEHAHGWQLAVAGTGDHPRMAALARAAGAEARLRLLGRIGEISALYAAADAFVFPTSYEAFPLVALEAAASGLPLLITRVNGAEDLIEDGVNGWFIERDPLDIARRLLEIAADPNAAWAMGNAAVESARPYTWDAMAERYLSLYDELTSP